MFYALQGVEEGFQTGLENNEIKSEYLLCAVRDHPGDKVFELWEVSWQVVWRRMRSIWDYVKGC